MIERRRFSRIIYQMPAIVVQGSHHIATTIQDLSLHGLLLSSPKSDKLNINETAQVEFTLPESDITISLVANLISINNNVIRAIIDHIDIDSIAHLRRLVELNVGDDALLHRELEYLSDLGDIDAE
ncbi:PilZ domain-containing protein [Vibrio aestuarianus]|uniref:PilZ domain-containing protein n=1 Tax=Vibrio aestuarianus TaxID=28171 RepID=UPI00237C6BAF|nr:PilZ domain-containing protein [Vibrio aestuarianus]MDE1220056.1 PilZ domain-containing protein [Vibrio aestuarianus]MDE1238284.1 PilZ domain-containing protein [Vibrio aestuarianus]